MHVDLIVKLPNGHNESRGSAPLPVALSVQCLPSFSVVVDVCLWQMCHPVRKDARVWLTFTFKYAIEQGHSLPFHDVDFKCPQKWRDENDNRGLCSVSVAFHFSISSWIDHPWLCSNIDHMESIKRTFLDSLCWELCSTKHDHYGLVAFKKRVSDGCLVHRRRRQRRDMEMPIWMSLCASRTTVMMCTLSTRTLTRPSCSVLCRRVVSWGRVGVGEMLVRVGEWYLLT